MHALFVFQVNHDEHAHALSHNAVSSVAFVSIKTHVHAACQIDCVILVCVPTSWVKVSSARKLAGPLFHAHKLSGTHPIISRWWQGHPCQRRWANYSVTCRKLRLIDKCKPDVGFAGGEMFLECWSHMQLLTQRVKRTET
jgi:hypothetical protein